MPPSPKLLVNISASRMFRCCTCVGLSSSEVMYKLLDFNDFLPPLPLDANSFDRDDFKSVQFGRVLFVFREWKIFQFTLGIHIYAAFTSAAKNIYFKNRQMSSSLSQATL